MLLVVDNEFLLIAFMIPTITPADEVYLFSYDDDCVNKPQEYTRENLSYINSVIQVKDEADIEMKRFLFQYQMFYLRVDRDHLPFAVVRMTSLNAQREAELKKIRDIRAKYFNERLIDKELSLAIKSLSFAEIEELSSEYPKQIHCFKAPDN